MTEAELAIEEKLRKKREEQEQIWQEYLEQREKERQKEEADLKKLKERQQRRKAQRAEQERLMQEMRRKQEETRQRELEERRRKEADAKRKRLEDAEKKRLIMQEAIRRRDEEAKRNFFVRKTADAAQTGPMIVGMRDVMKTKEQLAEDKRIAMKYRLKPLKIEDGLRTAELKKIVNDLWANIVQLESDKYDLEEEQRRQEYHLKELMERQKQINKNKALKMGLEMEDLSGKYPPKVRLASKYERRIDRRSFNEKTELFDGGYVESSKSKNENEWAKKINEFKENHGDKHVPKWDPSAPRKDTEQPGDKIYFDDSDDEETDILADKLRGFMKQSEEEGAGSRQQSRKSSTIAQSQQQQQLDSRRRSSQISNASSTTGASRQQQHAAPKQQLPRAHQQQEEDDEDEEEYDEEEYTDEEVEE